MNTIRLNDGNDIPSVGFGVFMIPSDGPTYDAVLQALQAGYRHIDTAAAYFNESDVGRAVRDSGIPRQEIFITSKLWLQDYGYEAAKKGIEASLSKLNMDYRPVPAASAIWRCQRGMEGAGRSQGSRQAEIDRRKQYDTEDLEDICSLLLHQACGQSGRMSPVLPAARAA